MSRTFINQLGFDVLQPTRDTPTYIIWFHDIQLCTHFLDDFPSGLRDISVNINVRHFVKDIFKCIFINEYFHFETNSTEYWVRLTISQQ